MFATAYESTEELAMALVGLNDVELIHDLVDYCHEMEKTETPDVTAALNYLTKCMLQYMLEHMDSQYEIGQVMYSKKYHSAQELMDDLVDLEEADLNLELVEICYNEEYLDTL